MSFRTVTRRDRLVRRALLAAVTAGITALGVVTLPLAAAAEPVAPAPSAVAADDERDTADRSHGGPTSPDHRSRKADSGAVEPGSEAPQDAPQESPGQTPGETLDPRFAPFAEAAITPGVELLTPLDGTGLNFASCTANFVYTQGDAVFIGSAAHCASQGDPTSLDGCTNDSVPLGTEVIIVGLDGQDYVGTLAYSSWLTMQAVGETNPDECFFNDIALIEIDPADVDQVNPSVPIFGGPEGLDTDGVDVGERVFSYQNARDDDSFPVMRAKQGVNRENLGGGRRHNVATTTPGFPGDSGSGYLDAEGRAFGVLSTVFSEDGEIRNGVSDLAFALDYAIENAGFSGIEVVNGTVPFSIENVETGAAPAPAGGSLLPALPAPPGLGGVPALPAAPGGMTLPLIG